MSDIDGGNAGTTTDGNDGASQATDTNAGANTDANTGKSFTQEDVDRLIADRLTRERGKYSDYADLKTKASEFDKIQDANKSELEKANEAFASAQAELAVLKVERVRREAADKAGLPADLLEYITASDPDEAAAQAKRLAERLAPPAQAAPPAGQIPQGQRQSGTPQKSFDDVLRNFVGR